MQEGQTALDYAYLMGDYAKVKEILEQAEVATTTSSSAVRPLKRVATSPLPIRSASTSVNFV